MYIRTCLHSLEHNVAEGSSLEILAFTYQDTCAKDAPSLQKQIPYYNTYIYYIDMCIMLP